MFDPLEAMYSFGTSSYPLCLSIAMFYLAALLPTCSEGIHMEQSKIPMLYCDV